MTTPGHSYFLYRQNHVCLEHHTTSRVESARCPVCGLLMRAIGTRWRIPKKADERGWRELREMIRKQDNHAAGLNATRFAHYGISIVEERLPSEYRAEYGLRRIIRRPGS